MTASSQVPSEVTARWFTPSRAWVHCCMFAATGLEAECGMRASKGCMSMHYIEGINLATAATLNPKPCMRARVKVFFLGKL